MENTVEIPQSIESEVAVIAAIMYDGRDAMKKIQHILTKEDFYDKRHAIIWRAAVSLMQRDKDVDAITIADMLKRKGMLDTVGGMEYMVSTMESVSSGRMVEKYARIVADRAVARRVIKAAQDIVQSASSVEDIGKFIYESEQRLKGVTKSSARQESKQAVVDLEEWRKIAREVTPPSGTIRGISLGWDKVDQLTEGFEPGEMMVVTGHTKHGKSKFATNVCWNVAQQGKNVMFINTEMTKLQVARRINQMGKDGAPTKGKIYINDRADLESYDVTALMEKAKELGCDLVIVDHLHFFSRSIDNMTAEISRITKEFKEAAVQYELPLMLLCHINKGDTRKKPTLEMLKNSSSIAQDADIVVAVFRDDRPTATDPFKTSLYRLAHRSAERAITHVELYGDGMKLLSERPPTTKQQEIWQEDRDKILGEDDGNNEEKPW